MDLAIASDGPAVVTTPSATPFIDRDSNGAHRRNQHAYHDLQSVVDSGTVHSDTVHSDTVHSDTADTEGPGPRPNRTEGSDCPN
jgi:hypothetical protein